MASTREKIIQSIQRTHGKSGDPQGIFAARMERLDTIIDTLRANSMAPWIKVFGSAIAKPRLVPGDIDIFVDLSAVKLDKDSRAEALSSLLQLAVAGGYHGNYGMFDPFVLNRKGVLYTRNEASDSFNVGWQVAQKPETIIVSGRAGVLITTFNRHFQQQFPAEA